VCNICGIGGGAAARIVDATEIVSSIGGRPEMTQFSSYGKLSLNSYLSLGTVHILPHAILTIRPNSPTILWQATTALYASDNELCVRRKRLSPKNAIKIFPSSINLNHLHKNNGQMLIGAHDRLVELSTKNSTCFLHPHMIVVSQRVGAGDLVRLST
jgi:hypothetical protein